MMPKLPPFYRRVGKLRSRGVVRAYHWMLSGAQQQQQQRSLQANNHHSRSSFFGTHHIHNGSITRRTIIMQGGNNIALRRKSRPSDKFSSGCTRPSICVLRRNYVKSNNEESSQSLAFDSYPAMLRHYCKTGDADAALKLLREMPQPLFNSDQYMMVLATLADNGCFRNARGATLFDEIVSKMATQACDISPQSAIRLHNALTMSIKNESAASSSLLKDKWKLSEDIPIRDQPANDDELLACRVKIDPSTWTCNATNAQLHSQSLEPAKMEQMYEDILALGQKQSALVKELKQFSDWLNTRVGPPFTAIVDGANVEDIGTMVARLAARKERPLVVFSKEAGVSKLKGVVKKLRKKGQMYITPDGVHNDLFCMIATVTDQSMPHSIHAKPPSSPVLISNDSFHSLEQEFADLELVREWYSNHCLKSQSIPKARNTTIERSEWIQKSSLTPHKKEQMYEDILALAQNQSATVKELKVFTEWMNNRSGHPFTVILDGANVGSATESMVASLEENGEHPLVLLPEKLASERPAAMYRLKNKVYIVPDLHNDDLFCMIATVVDQNGSSSADESPSLPRISPVLISNDRFRDHEMVMNRPLVREWYGYHCYKHLSGKVKNLPPVCSRRIKKNTPTSGRNVWHISGLYEKFVVRIRQWCNGKDTELNSTKQKDNRQGDSQPHLPPFTLRKRKQIYEDILASAHNQSTLEKELKKFSNWLNNRTGHPFTFILDGANIGSIDLQSMVASLEAKGEYPLLVLPEKVVTKATKSAGTINRFRKNGKLFVVPCGLDDDLFCILATVAGQHRSFSSHDNPQSPGPVLISNDRFLDHKRKMNRALFLEWQQHHCHPSYSKKLITNEHSRIEWNDWPNESYGNKVWHFPVRGWGYYERFVIRLPIESKNIVTPNIYHSISKAMKLFQ